MLRRARLRRARAGLGLVALLAAACGSRGPRWLDLAALPVHGESPEGPLGLESGPEVRVLLEQGDLWLETVLERAAWSPGSEPGRWSAELRVVALGTPRSGAAPYRLEAEGGSAFEYGTLRSFGKERSGFSTSLLELLLWLPEGQEPPERCRLLASANYQKAEDGVLRVSGRRLSGEGFWVPPGKPRTVEVELPPGSRLSFSIATEAVLGARELRTVPHRFRVRLDGATLFEQELEVNPVGEALRRCQVELPRGGVRQARLSFETEGPFALTSFLGVQVGPAEIGRYGARPWGQGRPDLVVFLADTFRADNLTAYGGQLGLTPNLDRFGEEARLFTRSWSTATHTLPSHSSMFSGVYPHQNGQVDFFNPLPAQVETLAERLSAAGYRCGAISDGVMVSHTHGLDQGFESFDERYEAGTVERTRDFLAADDGRPIFLFVQTYAVHAPYAPKPETRRRLAQQLDLDADFEQLSSAISALEWPKLGPGDVPGVEFPEEARPIAARMRQLYLAEVNELDATFGRLRELLEQQGLWGTGYFLFTSDHGEAFLEHGRVFHAGAVYDEELRVPLILAGPTVPPGRETRPVSLIDFAPTLARLAGLEPRPHWEGRSLLDPAEHRMLYAFQSRDVEEATTLAVIDGTRKLIGYEDPESVRAGRFFRAFDLATDPGEQHDLLGAGADWPVELERAQRERLLQLLTPLVTPEATNLTSDQARALEAMGYGGPERDDR